MWSWGSDALGSGCKYRLSLAERFDCTETIINQLFSDSYQNYRLVASDNCINISLYILTSLVDQSVKNLPAVQETRVQSLGWENPLEMEITMHSSILAWKISWTKEPGGLQSMGSQRVRHDWATNTHLLTYFIIYCNAITINNKVHNKCNVLESSRKQPPYPLGPWKNCPMKPIPDAKMVGDHWSIL